MDNEYKLVICILLRAIADQDPQYVHGVVNSDRQEIVEDALRFCASEEYLSLCQVIGFNPHRRFFPSKAHQGLEAIRRQLGGKLAGKHRPVESKPSPSLVKAMPSFVADFNNQAALAA